MTRCTDWENTHMDGAGYMWSTTQEKQDKDTIRDNTSTPGAQTGKRQHKWSPCTWAPFYNPTHQHIKSKKNAWIDRLNKPNPFYRPR